MIKHSFLHWSTPCSSHAFSGNSVVAQSCLGMPEVNSLLDMLLWSEEVKWQGLQESSASGDVFISEITAFLTVFGSRISRG